MLSFVSPAADHTGQARKGFDVRDTPSFQVIQCSFWETLNRADHSSSGGFVCCKGDAGHAIGVPDYPQAGLPCLCLFLRVQCCDDRKRLGQPPLKETEPPGTSASRSQQIDDGDGSIVRVNYPCRPRSSLPLFDGPSHSPARSCEPAERTCLKALRPLR